MDREKLNNVLKRVIQEARELDIPVPDNIIEEILVNKRPKKRYGCCHRKDGKYLIEISEFVLQCSEENIRGVLAHEVLHTCEGCRDHGAKWKEYAARMNQQYGYRIKRVLPLEEMGLSEENQRAQEEKARYIIKCTRCGKEYPRQRFTCVMKKINAYRCQCGGKLIFIHNKAISN